MEFGLQLKLLSTQEMKKIEAVQRDALRIMLSVSKQTSVPAMCLISGVEPMAERNAKVYFGYLERLRTTENPLIFNLSRYCNEKSVLHPSKFQNMQIKSNAVTMKNLQSKEKILKCISAIIRQSVY